MTLLTDVNTTLAPSADQARQQFAIVPAYLALEATPAALKVYVALGLRADHETGICWPSHARIVADTDLSKVTVIRALDELVKLGAIERNHRKKDNGGDTSNLYRLTFAINRRANGGGTKNDTGGVQKTAHKPDSGEPDKNPPTPQTDFAAFGDLAAVVVVDPKTIPEREKHDPDALGAAIAEARKDPTVRNPEAVGRFRYNQQREQQREQARTESARVVDVKRIGNCRRCFGSGSVWFLADGTATTPDNPEGEYTERCDHRPALKVLKPSAKD